MELKYFIICVLLMCFILFSYHKGYRQILKELKEKLEDTKSNMSREYYKLFPKKIFTLLKIKEEENLQQTKDISTIAAVLAASTKSFSVLAKEMEATEIFPYTNEVLSSMIPIVTKDDGVIDKFIGAGVLAFYTDHLESALHNALEICNELKDKEIISIGLSYGSIMLGIVGNEERILPITISEQTGLAEHLQSIGEKYGSNILITSSYADQINGFKEKYAHRLLGYIYIHSSHTIEKRYDVYAGDLQERQWLKKKTRLMFEEGVNFFASGRYEEARLNFVEVLKVFRTDHAAKTYLYLCDQYKKDKVKSKTTIYIESY